MERGERIFELCSEWGMSQGALAENWGYRGRRFPNGKTTARCPIFSRSLRIPLEFAFPRVYDRMET